MARKDIFLCAIYIPPSESPYYSEDTFSTLEEETSHFQAQGNVLICGDPNARTGLQPDFTDTQGSKYINNKLTVITFTFMHLADAFIQSDLHCIQVTVSTFSSALAFPGNRTHDLSVASAMLYQLSYRKDSSSQRNNTLLTTHSAISTEITMIIQ